MISAVTRRELEYHLPSGEPLCLPAGTHIEVYGEGEHTPEQLRWLGQRARTRRVDDQGQRLPLPEVLIVRLDLHPDGWTSVPAEDLAFPTAEGWG